MISLRGQRVTTYLLVALAMVVAILVDFETPPRRLVAMLYAIPILIAAHGLSRLGVGVVGAAAVAVYLVNAWASDTPARLQIFSVVGLVLISYLSINLALQRDWALEHAREAQEMSSLLSALLVGAPMGLVFWDENLRCAWINAAFAGLLGVQPEQALGRTVRELLDEGDEGVEDDVRWVIKTKSPLAERVIRCANAGNDAHAGTLLLPGEEARWLASYYPVRNPDGDLVGVGCVAVRTTGRH